MTAILGWVMMIVGLICVGLSGAELATAYDIFRASAGTALFCTGTIILAIAERRDVRHLGPERVTSRAATPEQENSMEILDSRDLQAELDDNLSEQSDLLDELARLREPCEDEECGMRDPDGKRSHSRSSCAPWLEEGLQLELAELQERAEKITELKDETEAAGWSYGIAFVPEDGWVEYAQQTAEDIGAIDGEAGWPNSYIDWDAAADALRMDYSEVEFDGDAYLYREA